MQVISDSAQMGEQIAILAEEEAADKLEFGDDGSIIEDSEVESSDAE